MARPTSTPTCIPGWQRRRVKKASPRLRIGSRRSRRRRNRTQGAFPEPPRWYEVVALDPTERPAPHSGDRPVSMPASPRKSSDLVTACDAPVDISAARRDEYRMARIQSRPTDALSYYPNEKRYWEPEKLNREIERVFDICHGCR